MYCQCFKPENVLSNMAHILALLSHLHELMALCSPLPQGRTECFTIQLDIIQYVSPYCHRSKTVNLSNSINVFKEGADTHLGMDKLQLNVIRGHRNNSLDDHCRKSGIVNVLFLKDLFQV